MPPRRRHHGDVDLAVGEPSTATIGGEIDRCLGPHGRVRAHRCTHLTQCPGFNQNNEPVSRSSRQALRALRAGIRRSARWVAIVGWALLCAQRSSPAGCAALGCCTEHTPSKRLEEVVQREPVAAERLSMPGFVLTPARPGERSVDRQPTTTSRPAHFEDSHDLGQTWGRFSDLKHRLTNGAPAGAPERALLFAERTFP